MHYVKRNDKRRAGLDGERGRNRTFNLLIKSQLLCQLSYAPSTTYRPYYQTVT